MPVFQMAAKFNGVRVDNRSDQRPIFRLCPRGKLHLGRLPIAIQTDISIFHCCQRSRPGNAPGRRRGRIRKNTDDLSDGEKFIQAQALSDC